MLRFGESAAYGRGEDAQGWRQVKQAIRDEATDPTVAM